MKRRVQKFLSVVIISALLAGVPEVSGLAAETDGTVSVENTDEVEILEAEIMEDVQLPSDITSYTMMTQCYINVVSDSEGMHVGIMSGTVGTSSVLGIKDVRIQKKNWLGIWSTVATSSGGEAYDCGLMGITILYKNAEKGATYRILCVHYGDVDGYYEFEHDSGNFVHTY